MAPKKLVPALLTGLLGLSIAACSDPSVEKDAIPTPASSSEPGSSNGVPQVSRPLGASSFLEDPCKLVDNQTLSAFGEFEEGEPDVDSNHAQKLIGPTCVWYGKQDVGRAVSVIIDTPHQKYAQPHLRGLAGVYASKESGSLDYLQAVEIDSHPGYPAVIAGNRKDMEEGNRCVVYVGIADDLTIKTSLDGGRDPEEACQVAQKVAAAVLDTLKQAN